MLFFAILSALSLMVIVTLTAIMLIDIHFEKIEEKKRQERKALQEHYRKLIEG